MHKKNKIIIKSKLNLIDDLKDYLNPYTNEELFLSFINNINESISVKRRQIANTKSNRKLIAFFAKEIKKRRAGDPNLKNSETDNEIIMNAKVPVQEFAALNNSLTQDVGVPIEDLFVPIGNIEIPIEIPSEDKFMEHNYCSQNSIEKKDDIAPADISLAEMLWTPCAESTVIGNNQFIDGIPLFSEEVEISDAACIQSEKHSGDIKEVIFSHESGIELDNTNKSPHKPLEVFEKGLSEKDRTGNSSGKNIVSNSFKFLCTSFYFNIRVDRFVELFPIIAATSRFMGQASRAIFVQRI